MTPICKLGNTDFSATTVTPHLRQSQGKILPVIISDLKLDDNMMILLTCLRKQFASPHIIVSGLHNLKKGATTTQDFLENTLKWAPDARFILTRPGDQAVDHEINFIEEDSRLLTTSLDSYLKEARKFSHGRVMIIQIAQMRSENVDRLISTFGLKISAYALIAMFNAFQGSIEATVSFLNSLQGKIQLHNPASLFLYSDNVSSFARLVGSQVLFRELLPYIPLDHLKRAVRDPFQYTHIFGAAAALKSGSDDQCSRMARALYILGTTPNFWVRNANQDRAPPVLLELMERVRKEAKEGELIIALADELQRLKKEDQGDIFEETSRNSKALGKANKEGMALIKEGQGDALRAVVTSGRIQATETDRLLNKELIKFLELSIAPLEAQKNFYLSIRMATGVMKGFKEFTVELCDGLHWVVWLHVLFDGDSLERNLENIRQGKNNLVVPATFEHDIGNDRALARALSQDELAALSHREETVKPHQSLAEKAPEVAEQHKLEIRVNTWLLVARETDPKPLLEAELKSSLREIDNDFDLTELSPFVSSATDLSFSKNVQSDTKHSQALGQHTFERKILEREKTQVGSNEKGIDMVDIVEPEPVEAYEDLMHVSKAHV